MNRTFEVQNTIPEAESAVVDIAEYLQTAGVDEELVHDLRLVTEELLLNTVSYGYDADVKDVLTVQITKEEESLVLEFRDRANPFNPLEAEERDPDDDRIGGWGIHLMKELTDFLHYSREGDENVLILKKDGKK